MSARSGQISQIPRCRWRSAALAAVAAVVISLRAGSTGAQESSATAPPPKESPAGPASPSGSSTPLHRKSPLVLGLDSLVGGFFDGFFDTMERAAHLSLIARDWDAAQLLLGHLSPLDEVLRERSKRMLLVRRRLVDEGALVPFLELGLGQWRVDPDTPAIPHDVVLAAEVGGGAELHLSPLASLAAEAQCTVVNPFRGDALWIRNSTIWGSFLAARVKF